MIGHELFYSTAKSALTKAGWLIVADPFKIRLPGLEKFDDPAALQTFAAVNGERQIAVTVTAFLGPSLLQDFHSATGRFLIYELALHTQAMPHELYLALPLDTYEQMFERKLVQLWIKGSGLKLMVFSVKNEEVKTWIN